MRGGQATAEGRRYRGLVGLLTAEGIGLAGTRLSMIAIPWFVITTTGSAVLTGVVAFAEAAPYVVAKALGGPLIDRLGARRVAVAGDLAGMAAVAAIPLLYAAGVLELPVLLALVALLGLCRGPADGAKKTLIPDVVTRARVPMERATGLSGTLERLASTVGAAAGGAVVAAVGPLTALVVNAATFALAPAIVRLTVPVRRAGVADGGGYLAQLRGGVAFLRRERLLRSLAGMIAVTNLLEAAMFSVLLPVWAHSTGHGPVMVGVLAGSSAAAAIGSSLLASMLAHRLPRRATYLVSFLVAGAPRFVVLALDVPLPVIVAVWVAGGLGQGFLNPIIWAVIFERIPRDLLGRVQSLITSLAWAGIPAGPPVAGVLIGAVGLSPVLVCFGLVFLAVTILPGLQPEWARMSRPREFSGVAPVHAGAGVASPGSATVEG